MTVASNPQIKILLIRYRYTVYFIGAVHKIVEVDRKKRSESEYAAFNFRTKKISAYWVDNEICLTLLDCDCLFMNKYLLPCKHIFHEHMYGSTKLLTDHVWRTFQTMFEESGFEIYERREQITILMPQTEEQRRTDSRMS